MDDKALIDTMSHVTADEKTYMCIGLIVFTLFYG